MALIDDTEEIREWAIKDHCAAFCTGGRHCQKLVKVLKGEQGRIVRESV